MKETREQRLSPRRRVLKEVKLLLNSPNAVVNAIMRDISSTGAKLDLGTQTPLPLTFFIIFVAERARQEATLVWQRGNKAGITFVGERKELGVRKLIP